MDDTSNKKTSAPKGGKTQTKKAPAPEIPKKKPAEKAAAKPAPKSKPKQEEKYEADPASRRQVTAIMLMAVAAFLLAVVFVEGESVWNIIHNFMFGAFGFCAYILPLLLIYMGIVYARNKPLGGAALNLVSSGSFIVFLAAVIHLIRSQADYLLNTTLSVQISDVWQKRTLEMNGGVLGAVVGGAIGKLFGKTGALITVFILLAVALLLLTGITLPILASYIGRPVKVIRKATGERFEQNAAKREEIRERREREEAEEAEKEKEKQKIKMPPVITDTAASPVNSDFVSRDIKIKAPSPDINVDTGLSEPAMPVTSAPAVNAAAPGVPGKVTGNINIPVVTIDEPASPEKPVKKAAKTVKAAAEKTKKKIEKIPDGSGEIVEKHDYKFPPIECLELPGNSGVTDTRAEMEAGAGKLIDTLESFRIKAEITGIVRGPSVTRYELVPEAGVRISKITSLADDIAMRLAAQSVRIEAPIPGKSAIGIEIPNNAKSTVTLREIIDTDTYRAGRLKSKLSVALGKNITGDIIVADITKMPHLLVAGTTGSGKSVCMNAMIISILFNATPDEVRLLLIDPKQVEFISYNGIAHLEVPVVTDVRKAAGALSWAVSEMERRYRTFSECKVRDIKGYNKFCDANPDFEKMHHIVIFIDELSDLMMAAPKEVEDCICRLAQMARAAGIHLVIATQSPRADIITGLIKANIPSRIALKVANSMESRIIFDQPGAEKLLGNGDLLYNPVGISKPIRIQGCYITDEEKEAVLNHIKAQSEADYNDDVMREIEAKAAVSKDGPGKETEESLLDPMFDQAVEVVLLAGQASTTMLQKKLKLGYARASRVMDELEENGIVGPSEGAKPRQVLISKQEWYERQALAGGSSDKQLSFNDLDGGESEYAPEAVEEEITEDDDGEAPFEYSEIPEDEEIDEAETVEETDETEEEKIPEIITEEIPEDIPEDIPEEIPEEVFNEPVEEDDFADIYEDEETEPEEAFEDEVFFDDIPETDGDFPEEVPEDFDDFPDEIDTPVSIDDIFADDADYAGNSDDDI